MNGLPLILYDNRFNDATPVASSTAAGFNVLNLRDWRAYTWWKPSAMPATVTVDCGSAKNGDYCVVYGHDLGTKGATLEIRGSTDNFGASDVLVATKTPADDKPFLLTWASVSYRYWRKKITGATAPSMAIAAVGAALQLPRRLTRGFDPLGRTVRGQANRSEQGHPLGKVLEFEEWAESIKLRNMTWSWLRTTWKAAWDAHLRANPHVFAWDPTDHADELYLVSIEGQYSTPHQVGEYADLEYKVVGRTP